MVQDLKLCSATEKAETTNKFFLQVDLNIAKGEVTNLERDIADLQAQPEGRRIEGCPIDMTFEQESDYWKDRWQQVEDASGEVAINIANIGEEEYEGEVNRRVKKWWRRRSRRKVKKMALWGRDNEARWSATPS